MLHIYIYIYDISSLRVNEKISVLSTEFGFVIFISNRNSSDSIMRCTVDYPREQWERGVLIIEEYGQYKTYAVLSHEQKKK